MEENELDNAISLFPNPTSGVITLLNNSNIDIHTLTIMDINGRIIQRVDIEGTTTSTNFSVASLAQGMYFVKIETDTASIVKKIAKK
jgi:extracellular elastinolytic metalloproteinase